MDNAVRGFKSGNARVGVGNSAHRLGRAVAAGDVDQGTIRNTDAHCGPFQTRKKPPEGGSIATGPEGRLEPGREVLARPVELGFRLVDGDRSPERDRPERCGCDKRVFYLPPERVGSQARVGPDVDLKSTIPQADNRGFEIGDGAATDLLISPVRPRNPLRGYVRVKAPPEQPI